MTVQEMLRAIATAPSTEPIQKRAVTNLNVLTKPMTIRSQALLCRAMRLDLNGIVVLLISGTAASMNMASPFTLGTSAPS